MSRRSSSSLAFSTGVASELAVDRCRQEFRHARQPVVAASGFRRYPETRGANQMTTGDPAHGARRVSSSKAALHCRASACAHHDAWLSGPASNASTRRHVGGGGCKPIKAQPRRPERCRLGIGRRHPAPSENPRAGPAAFPRGLFPSKNLEGVPEPVKQPRPQYLFIGKCKQARPQCQQIGREVPAVNR